MPAPWILLIGHTGRSHDFPVHQRRHLWWETHRRRLAGLVIFGVSVAVTVALAMSPCSGDEIVREEIAFFPRLPAEIGQTSKEPLTPTVKRALLALVIFFHVGGGWALTQSNRRS